MNWYRIAQQEITLKMVKDPNCPPEVLVKVLARRKNDALSFYAAQNPNVPTSTLVEMLGKGENHWFSLYAALNPKCPLEAKVDWMEKVLLFVMSKSEEINVSDFSSPSFLKLFKELKDKSFLLSALWEESKP